MSFKKNNSPGPSIRTGFNHLDNVFNGFSNDDLVVIASRPNVGKTTFILNIINNLLLHQKYENTVIFFSLECPACQIGMRLLKSGTSIDNQCLADGSIDSQQLKELFLRAGGLSGFNLYIDDSQNITIDSLHAKLFELTASQSLGIIFLDYLELIVPAGVEGVRMDKSGILHKLKNIASEFNCPVIVLSQLSRSDESVLHESQIIADRFIPADMVFILQKNGIVDMEDPSNIEVNVIIAKQKNSNTAIIPLRMSR